mmetsp:Transcript_34102/g.111240  ORF Transcript_34102/g.111240 Transcript_34102/m.111240 type:complete len:197 (-) Transcript_34102:63-653(-)
MESPKIALSARTMTRPSIGDTLRAGGSATLTLRQQRLATPSGGGDGSAAWTLERPGNWDAERVPGKVGGRASGFSGVLPFSAGDDRSFGNALATVKGLPPCAAVRPMEAFQDLAPEERFLSSYQHSFCDSAGQRAAGGQREQQKQKQALPITRGRGGQKGSDCVTMPRRHMPAAMHPKEPPRNVPQYQHHTSLVIT